VPTSKKPVFWDSETSGFFADNSVLNGLGASSPVLANNP
jgi:hypothetical protein